MRLSEPGSRAALLDHSPAGKVPVLKHGGRVVWDSLAIIEYLAEQRPAAGLWPAEADARALARSIAAEMHAGFAPLRNHMPMNLRKSLPGKGRGPGVADDIARISAIWADCRRRFGAEGPFLFGRASAADAMYAPVATRFRTYGVELDPVSTCLCRCRAGLAGVSRVAGGGARGALDHRRGRGRLSRSDFGPPTIAAEAPRRAAG